MIVPCSGIRAEMGRKGFSTRKMETPLTPTTPARISCYHGRRSSRNERAVDSTLASRLLRREQTKNVSQASASATLAWDVSQIARFFSFFFFFVVFIAQNHPTGHQTARAYLRTAFRQRIALGAPRQHLPLKTQLSSTPMHITGEFLRQSLANPIH